MDESGFWAIIDFASQASEPSAKEDALREKLRALSPNDLRSYVRHWDSQMDAAYDWKLWAAAYVLAGGCSDDSFMDFRSSAILLGRESFVAVCREPDRLAGIASNMDQPAWWAACSIGTGRTRSEL